MGAGGHWGRAQRWWRLAQCVATVCSLADRPGPGTRRGYLLPSDVSWLPLGLLRAPGPLGLQEGQPRTSACLVSGRASTLCSRPGSRPREKGLSLRGKVLWRLPRVLVSPRRASAGLGWACGVGSWHLPFPSQPDQSPARLCARVGTRGPGRLGVPNL